MKKCWWIVTILGCIGFSVIFPIFAYLSFRLYPGGFNFNEHYLSYLGGDVKNPDGYFFYNIGVIIAGVSLLLLMIGFEIWQYPSKRVKVFLVLIRLAGAVEGISVFAVGIFPDRHPLHMPFSSIYGVSNVFLTILLMGGLLFHPGYKKWISLFILGLLGLTGLFLVLGRYEYMELATVIGTCICFVLLFWNMWVIQKSVYKK